MEQLFSWRGDSDEGAARDEGEARTKSIVVFAVGSRGDVQPSCVLALALQASGHEVHVATEERLKPLVDEFKLRWRRLEGDKVGVLHEPEAQDALRQGSFFKLMQLTKRWEARFDKQRILASFVEASEGADVIVASALCLTECLSVAQLRRAAFVSLIPGPTWPTSEFPLWALQVPCSCLYRQTYYLAFGALWAQEKPQINPWRKSLGLPPLEASAIGVIARTAAPTLVAASELMCGPHRKIPADYPEHVIVGGFLFAPEKIGASLLEAELRRFVEPRGRAMTDSRPVVYFGFGSMPAPDPAELLQLVVDTCAAARCRAVLTAGWSALESDPRCYDLARSSAGTVLVRKAVPHGWFFPQCAVLVHHAGVGTLAAALRAGVPQVPCPFMLDQSHNARLAVDLGVAPEIVPYDKRISAARLARAIKQILEESGSGPLCTAARAVGEQVRAESSRAVGQFVSAVENAKIMSAI